jgi:hypothetical protein
MRLDLTTERDGVVETFPPEVGGYTGDVILRKRDKNNGQYAPFPRLVNENRTNGALTVRLSCAVMIV